MSKVSIQCGHAVGVAGPNDKFSFSKTWNCHGAWHRGVPILTLSLPLSWHISSKVNSGGHKQSLKWSQSD